MCFKALIIFFAGGIAVLTCFCLIFTVLVFCLYILSGSWVQF